MKTVLGSIQTVEIHSSLQVRVQDVIEVAIWYKRCCIYIDCSRYICRQLVSFRRKPVQKGFAALLHSYCLGQDAIQASCFLL